jgi:LCP family protein required for cell wall assembly
LLLVSGYGWSAYHDLSAGLTRSEALDGPGLLFHRGDSGLVSEPMNILIMGLDSRLDQNGDPLPAPVLKQLHAGDGTDGGYNTNVLMLLHVPAGGGRAQVVSIPRDDFVALPGAPSGEAHAKIKEGYGLAKAEAERRLLARGVTDRTALERQGREAGRRQTIADVEEFLNVPIDHFVEVTLVGFYDLATALGSVTVCLTGPTQDSYSGAKFARGGQRLNAAQALAFVRQRRDYVHPELNFTDLDRARRQQAFLASAAYQLNTAGTFTNPARLAGLIEVAKKDVVIDEGFDPLGFITRHTNLLDGEITFTTLPVKRFETINGEAANIVDKRQNQALVARLFGTEDGFDDRPTPPATVDVVNATGRHGLASQVSSALSSRGLTAGTVSTQHGKQGDTIVEYGAAAQGAARALARLLNQPAPRPNPQLAPTTIRLTLGTDFHLPPHLADASEAADTANRPVIAPPPAIPASSISAGGIPCVK